MGKKGMRQRGFTLVEVMLGLSILAITLLGALSLISLSWDILLRTQEKIYISRILESRVEELRDLSFDELLEQPAQFEFSISPNDPVPGRSINPLLYQVEADFTRTLHGSTGIIFLDEITPGLMRLVVRITWRPGGGQTVREMKTVTYVTRNGISRR